MAFGQELKDFVVGARHGYEMASDRRDKKYLRERQAINDEIDNAYKTAQTEMAVKGNQWFDRLKQADLDNTASAIALRNKQASWVDREQQSLLDARRADMYYKLNGGGRDPYSRLRTDEDYDTLGGSAPEGRPQALPLEPTAFNDYLMPGRYVQAAADGGLIADLPEEAPIPQRRPALEAEPQMEAPVTPEGNAPAKTDLDPRVVGFERAQEAVMEGMNYSLQQMGFGGGEAIKDPEKAKVYADYLRGRGAAPQSVIQQAYAVVDPNNELPESERTMAALATVYDHYNKQGNPEKAKAAAASIVQYQRRLFATYASIAQAAAEDGNIDGTVEAAVRAYASVPDGKNVKVQKTEDGRYALQIIDEATGEVIDQPVLTPQEIGGWAMQVSPTSFDDFIAGASGQKQTGTSKAYQALAARIDKGDMPTAKDMAALEGEEQNLLRAHIKDFEDKQGKKATLEQVGKIREDVANVWTQMEDMMVGPESDELYYPGMAEMPTTTKKAILDAAVDAVASPRNHEDTNVSEQDAIEAAAAISQTRDFTKENKNGGALITLPNDVSVWMPFKHFQKLDSIYKRADKERRDTAARDKARADRDAAIAEQDRLDTRAVVDEQRQGLLQNENPWSNPYSGAAIPMEGVDNGGQAALDRLNELLR